AFQRELVVMSQEMNLGVLANTGRKQDGRFQPRVSGNPAGRPQGSRNRASVIAGALAEGALEGIVNQIIKGATRGLARHQDVILARTWPVRKGRKIQIDLPEVQNVADIVVAMAAVTRAVADGEITPDEGQAVAAVAAILQSQLKVI